MMGDDKIFGINEALKTVFAPGKASGVYVKM